MAVGLLDDTWPIYTKRYTSHQLLNIVFYFIEVDVMVYTAVVFRVGVLVQNMLGPVYGKLNAQLVYKHRFANYKPMFELLTCV